jgi:hypothetical protein
MHTGLIPPPKLTRKEEDEILYGLNLKNNLAFARQQRLNNALAASEIGAAGELGQRIARIDAEVYLSMQAKHGRECWNDNSFLKDCMKRGIIKGEKYKSRKTSIIK